jgi:hypothetical protein
MTGFYDLFVSTIHLKKPLRTDLLGTRIFVIHIGMRRKVWLEELNNVNYEILIKLDEDIGILHKILQQLNKRSYTNSVFILFHMMKRILCEEKMSMACDFFYVVVFFQREKKEICLSSLRR